MTSKKCFIYTVYKTYLEVLVISNEWTENEEKPFAHSHAYIKLSKPLFFKEMKDYLIEKYHVGDSKELTKCCEPLQKLRVRLGTCKTGLSPPVTLCY